MKIIKKIILASAIFGFSISYAQGYNSLGQKDGPWEVTIQGVRVFEGTFNDGIKEGLFKTYYHGSGNLENVNNFVNDKFHGIQKAYSETGVLLWEANYVNGVKVGTETKYHDNGNIKAELNYSSSGELEGGVKVYDENGSLLEMTITIN